MNNVKLLLLMTNRISRTMRFFLLLVLTSLSCTVSISHAAQRPLILDSSTDHELSGHMAWLSDPDGKISFAEVLAAQESFQEIPGVLNRGYTSETSWVHFSFVRTEDFSSEFYLWLDHPYINNVTVYVQTGSDPGSETSYSRYDVGDHAPVSKRPLSHPNMVIPLTIQDHNAHSVYVRIQTNSSHSLSGRFLSSSDFIYTSNRTVFLQGGYFLIALVLGVFNLMHAIRLRDSIYTFYSGYLLTLGVRHLGAEGLMILIWPDAFHLLSDYLVGLGVMFNFCIFSFFVMRLFETRERFPWVHKYFQLIFSIGFIGSFFVKTEWYSLFAQLLIINGIVFTFLLLGLATRLMRQGVPEAKLYLIAFLPSSIGGIVLFLMLLGFLPVNWLTSNSLFIGSIFHMILTSLALTERVLMAEQKALLLSRDAEQIAIDRADKMTIDLQNKQKQLEQALVKEQRIRNSQAYFIDTISHEYKTPLAIIRANLDTLIMIEGKKTAMQEPFAKMDRAIRRLVEIFELAVDNHHHYQKNNIPMEPLMNEIIMEAKSIWGERFRVDIHIKDSFYVRGDKSFLKTALLNLLDNAIKYSPDGDSVNIALKNNRTTCDISIINKIDTKGDIDTNMIFDKFFRSSAHRNIEGKGIGLYIVHEIIKRHSGDIQADIHGATFRIDISLPIMPLKG